MKKILIVDDSDFLRGILKEYLGRAEENYQLEEAASAEAAWACFQKERPDLVLLDIVMGSGGKEGVEVLQTIKGAVPQCKVIMLTAVGQEKIIKECETLGCDDYITKPFNEKRLLEAIEKHLR